MDEEFDPGHENVNSVLAQESSELIQILASQSPMIIMKLCALMPGGASWSTGKAPRGATSSSAAVPEVIRAMLEYFTLASSEDCCRFLQSVCLLCENIPMLLESRLMSAAGYANSAHPGPSVTNEELSSSPNSEEQLIKRPRIDHWQSYITAVNSLMQRRWERLSETLVNEVHLENVWINQRAANRSRERPDQTPRSADRGNRTPDPDGDFWNVESRLTMEDFLQECAGKMTVVVGQAGSGKTLLMSRLGQQWACGLGPIPSSSLFVLLEFRQLNLLTSPISLFELLFQYYLPPEGGDATKKAIVENLLLHPEQSCWVLDGYDEFYDKSAKHEVKGKWVNPEIPLPVTDLISGLLNGQLLPGCTVLVTCRMRDIVDFEIKSDKMGQLLGWDRPEIKEYVENFFRVKGDSADMPLGRWAADLLFSNDHLVAMSYTPALCNMCCICLKCLLDEHKGDSMKDQPKEERMGRAERDLEGLQQSGETQGRTEDGTFVQIPLTLTQVYLTVLGTFLSRDPNAKENTLKEKDKKPPLNSGCKPTDLSRHGSELCELSHLAWKGIEENKILFMMEDIPHTVMEFSFRTGLLTQVELRLEGGKVEVGCCFIHLTIQEFLAALRIMSSGDVSDEQLKKRISLKSRWTTKSDLRTVFTDSLHLFLCGLASKDCTAALVVLAKASGQAGVQSWVQKRQTLVVKLLKSLCHSTVMTGPKILELCHCVQESQHHQLAKEVVGTRSTLELRNIRLLPKDIDALAFVMNSLGDTGLGLDFGSCSMELECLDVLQRCQHIQHLSFRGRKYDDKIAEKLSFILPGFSSMRKLEFCGTNLTSTGTASLASALKKCPLVSEINLSDNNLKDDGIRHVADIFTSLPKLVSVKLSRNNSSLEALDYLIGKMSSCLNIQQIYADSTKEVTVTFCHQSDINSHKKSAPTVRLLNQKWNKLEMQKVSQSLAQCPALSMLDLSGGQWNVEILETLTQFLPKFKITNRIVLGSSCSSVNDLVVLTALLPKCPTVLELQIRLQSGPEPGQVSIVFSGGCKKPANTKTLSLSGCKLLHKDLERVWMSLGTPCDITELDLSRNCLGNKGLEKLLDIVPHLGNIQEINASNNDIGMEGVVMLAAAFSSCNNLTQINISDKGKERVILKFCTNKSDELQQLKVLRLNDSSFLPSHIAKIFRKLIPCDSPLEIDLSHSSLKDEAVASLLRVLPKMATLQRLNVSNSISSATAALTLVSCLTVSQRVSSVELRSCGECFINFAQVKAEQPSCRLTHFSLNSDDLVERLTEILQEGPHLSHLDLSSNELEDKGVKWLMDSLPGLQINSYFNLSNNRLTQLGLLDVANALLTCDAVSHVEVSLGEEARCLLWFTQHTGCEKTLSVKESSLEREHLDKLSEIVSNCPSLTTLVFQNNSLQSEWIEDFVKVLDIGLRSCSISVEESWIAGEKAVFLVCRCLELSSNVQKIRVHRSALHLSLTKSTGLTSLSFADCALEGHQLSHLMTIIHKCPSLTELAVSLNSVGPEGAQSLSTLVLSLPKLSSLSVASKEMRLTVAEKFSEALLQTKSVHCLNLSGLVISDRAAQNITSVFPHLQSLNLSHCLWSAAEGLQLLKALQQCVGLEELCLDSVKLDENGLVCLADVLRKSHSMCSLKLNKVTGVMGPPDRDSGLELLAATERLTQMKEIELDGWKMSDKGVEQLTKLIPQWTQLRKMRLSENFIDDQSGDRLLEALKSCVHLEELYLSRNHLGDLTAARMALVLPSMTHVTVLDISENRIGGEGSANLSKAVMCMKKLTKIRLTSVGTPQLGLIVASLVHCPLIQDVGLGWNGCGDDVAMELVRVLPVCLKLTRIDLESNCVSVAGVEALLKVLHCCPALQIIRLWRNTISHSEAQKLNLKDRRLNFSST